MFGNISCYVSFADRKIEIPLPNESARVDILKIHSAKVAKSGDIGMDMGTVLPFCHYTSVSAEEACDALPCAGLVRTVRRFLVVSILNASDYDSVCKLCDGFNGADLRNVCTEAGGYNKSFVTRPFR